MAPLSLEDQAEIFAPPRQMRGLVDRALKRGDLRRLARGLYTRNLIDQPEDIIARNRWRATAAFFPGALIADRSVQVGGVTADGQLFVVHDRASDLELPGLVIRPRRGSPAHEFDMTFAEGLFFSSIPRALLDNTRSSRSRGARLSRTLSRSELEEWLEHLLQQHGEERMREYRAQMRLLAPELGLEQELELVDPLVGAVLGTRRVHARSEALRARQADLPFDEPRVRLFEQLRDHLAAEAPGVVPVLDPGALRHRTLPFYEAYFSNFIEGTEFSLEEAAEIVFEQTVPVDRPEDAHDILGTYRIVADRVEMSRTPDSPEELDRLLRDRHRIILDGRPAERPGEYKLTANRVGQTEFVAPSLVIGTLAKGFELYGTLETAFGRAVFQMFLIAEVHPFEDGNGRMARIMMNAELVAADDQRIIIPNVYRNNYVMALRALTHNQRSEALTATLRFAQRYTAAIDFTSIETAREVLERTNAFADPAEADALGRRLVLP
jgi:hypothetical protein